MVTTNLTAETGLSVTGNRLIYFALHLIMMNFRYIDEKNMISKTLGYELQVSPEAFFYT